MRRTFLLALPLALLAALTVTTPAQAASFSCPSFHVDPPTESLGVVAMGWGARCNNSPWNAQLALQYEQGGRWYDADCVNNKPCSIARPSQPPLYAAGSSHGGTVHFDIDWNCYSTRFRGLLYLIGNFYGTVLGPFASQPGPTC